MIQPKHKTYKKKDGKTEMLSKIRKLANGLKALKKFS